MPAINPLPTPPSRNDPANFSDRADAFLAALPAYTNEANALLDDVHTSRDTVQGLRDEVMAAGLASAATNAATATTKAAEASASAAEASASAAEASASAAEAFGYLQAYRATSYGALASDPVVDPNGNPPTVGDEYFNTTLNLLKRFNGVTWQASDVATANLAAPGGSALVGFKQSGTGAVARTAQDKLREVLSVKDFGAVGDGVADDSNALETMWQYIKNSAVNYDPTTLDWVTTRYVIPPGKYRVTRSINWTNLLAWNIHIEAKGALIVAEVNSKPVMDMLNTRGVHLDGLSVQTAAGYTPKSAFLVGIGATGTCGNNRFSAVKTAGSFSIAACHNIGSETTRYDFCYWQNKVGTGYAYAADCNNLLGAVSDYVTLRAPGTPVSFTSNAFYGCRFANYAASGNSVYLEGTAGWFFDKMNYYLAFDNANIIIRQGPNNRTASLKIAGLFETSQGAGLKDCVKIVLDDGANSAIDGFELDVATPHASRSVIRLETPAGTELTSGEFLIRTAVIKWDAVWTGTPTLFSGEKLSFLGDLYVRPSANINLSKLVKMHGCIYTTDASLVTKGADGVTHAYMMVDTATLAAQGISFGGIGGGFVGIQAASSTQRIRAVSSATNSDLWLSGKGTGRIRFGTRTASADAPVTGYIEILDDGGTIRRLAVIG